MANIKKRIKVEKKTSGIKSKIKPVRERSFVKTQVGGHEDLLEKIDAEIKKHKADETYDEYGEEANKIFAQFDKEVFVIDNDDEASDFLLKATSLEQMEYLKERILTRKSGGTVSPQKAEKILHDKEIRGHKLTDKQRRFFGARASGYPVKRKEGGGYAHGGSIATRTEAVKKVIEGMGYKIKSSKLDVEDIAGSSMPTLLLFLDKEPAPGSEAKMERNIRDTLNMHNAPRVGFYPDDETGKNIVEIDLYAEGGKLEKGGKVHRIKIQGKYYVADDEPTSKDKSKALTYGSKLSAKRDAEIIKEQWGLENKDVKVMEKGGYAEGGKVKTLRGYSVNFYRRENVGGQSYNVVSNGQFDHIVLVTDGVNGDASTVNSDEPYLQLKTKHVTSEPYLYAEPVNMGTEGKWVMFGGAFVYTSDSRFTREVSRQPIPVHDRVESYKLSSGGSMEEGGRTLGKYVAVSETKDGYWVIISKPTTKEIAQSYVDQPTVRGEKTKLVTLEEAKAHKKVLGREYLSMATGGVVDRQLSEMISGYKQAILFAESDEDGSWDDYTIHDFSQKTNKEIESMFKKYISENKEAISKSGMSDEQIGMDVWYTQKGHGAGFFDRNLQKDIEKKLTDSAEKMARFPEVEIGDDKKVHIRGIKLSSGGSMATGGVVDEFNLKLHPIHNNYYTGDGVFLKAPHVKLEHSFSGKYESGRRYAQYNVLINNAQWHGASVNKDESSDLYFLHTYDYAEKLNTKIGTAFKSVKELTGAISKNLVGESYSVHGMKGRLSITVPKRSMATGGRAEGEKLCIGDIYYLPDEKGHYTVISSRSGGRDGSYSYPSNKNGKPVAGGRVISSNSWLGKTPVKVGHIDLEQVTRSIGGECYQYYKSGDETIDIEMANLDSRWEAFAKNATEKQRAKYDEQEDRNYHFENAKMVTDWFDEHFEDGGRMAKGSKVGNENEITYNGKTITKLFPSGYYEFYSDEQERFLKADDLDVAKEMIDSESKSSGRSTMASGGFVSKGEMVWNKLTSSKRAEFLYENFTPEITPRSQEILVGKAYNFLPKNVKIKIEAKYANVEEGQYENGGSTMAGGAGIKNKYEFYDGDVVWDRGNKTYGVVLNNFGNPNNGEGGEIRLDSDGMQSIFEYDDNGKTGKYNLVPYGSKEDKGDGDLSDAKASAKRLIESNKDWSTERSKAYSLIYCRLLSGEFDKKKSSGGSSMAGGGKTYHYGFADGTHLSVNEVYQQGDLQYKIVDLSGGKISYLTKWKTEDEWDFTSKGSLSLNNMAVKGLFNDDTKVGGVKKEKTRRRKKK